MKDYLRIKIISKDRMGIVLDILKKFCEYNISIHSLEVFPEKVYIKLENLDEGKISELMYNIMSMKEVVKVQRVELIPYERDERRLLAIIDAVQDGIIAINYRGEVELFNKYCENIFNIKKVDALGKNI